MGSLRGANAGGDVFSPGGLERGPRKGFRTQGLLPVRGVRRRHPGGTAPGTRAQSTVWHRPDLHAFLRLRRQRCHHTRDRPSARRRGLPAGRRAQGGLSGAAPPGAAPHGLAGQGPLRHLPQADRSGSGSQPAGDPEKATGNGAKRNQGGSGQQDRSVRRCRLPRLLGKCQEPGDASVLVTLLPGSQGGLRG